MTGQQPEVASYYLFVYCICSNHITEPTIYCIAALLCSAELFCAVVFAVHCVCARGRGVGYWHSNSLFPRTWKQKHLSKRHEILT